MNRLDNIGIGGAGRHRRFGILSKEGVDLIGQRFEPGWPHPRPWPFHLWPQALEGMARRTIRRPKEPPDMLRHAQGFRRLTAPVVHEDEMQRLLRRRRTCMPKAVNVGGMPLRHLEKDTFPWARLDGTRQRKGLNATRPRAPWLHPRAREPAPWPRPSPTAALLLAQEAYRTLSRGMRSRRDRCQLVLPQGRNMRLNAPGLFRGFFSARSGAPCVWRAGESARPGGPSARPPTRHLPAATMASSLGHWQRPPVQPRAGDVPPVSRLSAGAPGQGPWPS